MMDDRIVLSLLVDNTAGVLARVAGLFSRRGYNIESLTVGVTADPRYSRMTVVSLGDQTVLEQIKNQLDKLEDVRDIKELKPDRSVYRELMMVKVRASAQDRQAISAISNIFRATIVDVGRDSLTVMLTGDQSKLDALINLLEDYEILELARTGLTGLERGRYPIPAIKYNVSRRIFICQRSIIRKIVIYPCWMDRPLPSSVTAARVMPMR